MRDSPETSSEFGAYLDRALRYVAEWRQKRVVVKFGGRALEKNEIGTLLEDLVLLQKSGLRPVLVHGGGPQISRLLERLGVESKFIDGQIVVEIPNRRLAKFCFCRKGEPSRIATRRYQGILKNIGN